MNAIEVTNLTKVFRLYSSPVDRLREIVGAKNFHREFYALKDVSLEVAKGKTVGIIGQNGSGKSTLLKAICGVLKPTSGSVRVNGRISPLLELGAGFNPEFTGRENVYMNGALLGLSNEDMDERISDIEAFADIGAFVDEPVKGYSSGMVSRLAFAAAVNIDPEILVVDEILAVGDIFFQHKCIAKMEAFREEQKTILLVAHDPNFVRSFCDVVFLLAEGKIICGGDDPEYVTEQYLMLMRKKETEYFANTFRIGPKPRVAEAKTGFGSEAGAIVDVRVLDRRHGETIAFLAGDTIVSRIQVRLDEQVKTPSIGLMLRDERGYNIYGTNTMNLGTSLERDQNNTITVFFSFAPVLAPGSYSLVVHLHEVLAANRSVLVDKQVGVGVFKVIDNGSRFMGTVDLQARAYQTPAAREPSKSDSRESF